MLLSTHAKASIRLKLKGFFKPGISKPQVKTQKKILYLPRAQM